MFLLLCAARTTAQRCACFVYLHVGGWVVGLRAGCRLRFTTHSVVTVSLCTPTFFFFLEGGGVFSFCYCRTDNSLKIKPLNAKKPDTVCCNTFSPVGGSAAPCTQNLGANHSGDQGTSGGHLQVLMVMAFSFFTCRYCTLTTAFSF